MAEEDSGTYYGKSYFNDDVTFYGNVTFASASDETGVIDISANKITASLVSVASTILVGSGVTITTSSIQLTTGIVTASAFYGNGTVPVGGIIMWSGTITNIPPGWALCNGQTANGQTTPDLRARFIVGAGTDTANTWSFSATTGAQTFTASQTSPNVGAIGGEVAHQLIVAELAAHTHTYPDTTATGNGGGTSGPNNPSTLTSVSQSTSLKTTNTTGSGSDNYHENRPPYYALAFIMRVA